MSNKAKRFTAIGVAAAATGFAALTAQPTLSFAADVGGRLFAQANDTNGKPNNDAGTPNRQMPGNPAPNTQPPASSQPNEPASVILKKNATQSGVPARCASVADATERQKCMNTPKGN